MSKTMKSPYIKLKERLNQEDYELISRLETKCCQEDQITLKLELDYKLSDAVTCAGEARMSNMNEFMYFMGEQLIGYLGICSYGGTTSSEITGMVHPLYRRQGIFTKLFDLVLLECKRRNDNSILALCDHGSTFGQKFMGRVKGIYKFSEFEMYLQDESYRSIEKQLHGITFRKAMNADAYEIARQNMIYFGDELVEEKDDTSNASILLPEDEEKKGMPIYLAEKDDKIIGKAHLQLIDGITGGIYGLGVLPEYRGKGFGRAILLQAIEMLKTAKAPKIMLQVAAENATALNLYKSCGFFETSVMDYFEV